MMMSRCSMLMLICIFGVAPASAADLTEAGETQTSAVVEQTKGEPFAWGDFTWVNGGSRQPRRLLESTYFTGQIDIDVNYTYSFNRPNDDTVVGSTALARNNELTLSFFALGGDLHYENVRGRILTQFGTRSTVIPRNDGSILRGQFDLATAYRYISEAYTGYHWDVLYGLNVDVGIFMSYVGLFSYDNWENWAYQPSYTSDNTPWFFNGARFQLFPTDRIKVELWLINGWQTYAKFNDWPGVGYQFTWRPQESMSLALNGYVGTDTQDRPGRIRFHSDNSFLLRYYNNPQGTVTRGALSFTFDLGFEDGGGVTAFNGSVNSPSQNFISGMAYHRLWFDNNHYAWTFGGGYVHNPGRYLALLPTGAGAAKFAVQPGESFEAWDVSTTFDWMPSDWATWRIELVHRAANVDYFAGRGGVTSADGFSNDLSATSYQADLVKSGTRLVAAWLMRF